MFVVCSCAVFVLFQDEKANVSHDLASNTNNKRATQTTQKSEANANNTITKQRGLTNTKNKTPPITTCLLCTVCFVCLQYQKANVSHDLARKKQAANKKQQQHTQHRK